MSFPIKVTLSKGVNNVSIRSNTKVPLRGALAILEASFGEHNPFKAIADCSDLVPKPVLNNDTNDREKFFLSPDNFLLSIMSRAAWICNHIWIILNGTIIVSTIALTGGRIANTTCMNSASNMADTIYERMLSGKPANIVPYASTRGPRMIFNQDVKASLKLISTKYGNLIFKN